MALDSVALNGRVEMRFARRPTVHRAGCRRKLQATFVPVQVEVAQQSKRRWQWSHVNM
jgi:hypothetical protein